MNLLHKEHTAAYRSAMGELLLLYTQVDRLIMEACAERIATAPDEAARPGLAKQVGDESRYVAIQRQWMEKFGVTDSPVISKDQETAILEEVSTPLAA